MGARTASSRTTRTASTQSGSIATIGDPTTDTTNDYVLTGSGATSSAVFTQLLPAANAATSITSIVPANNPVISNIAYTDSGYNVLVGNTAANLSGAYASIFGSNFQSNSNVYINGSLVANTLVGTTRINLPLPAVSVVGNYNLMVFNSNSLAALATLSYNTPPVWTQSSFSSLFGVVSLQLSATGAVRYTITPGSSLPEGLSLNSATGIVLGTLAAAIYSFDVDATDQFGLVTTQTVTVSIGQAYTVNYLVVAGGGSGAGAPVTSGGISSGGGGGGVLASTFNASTADALTIAIGQGGASGTSPGTVPGKQGGNSYITSGTIGNIVAVGGGGGSVSAGAQPGGSGGGGGSTFAPANAPAGLGFRYPSPVALFYTPAGAQGYPGGQAIPYPGSPSLTGAGAGGGGAGGIGNDAVVSTPWRGGAGGAGYTWPVNLVTYAGGGGGNSGGFRGGPSGAGGPGGGGQGGGVGSDGSGNGTNGLGGGGGAGAPAGFVGPNSASGAGGSGIIIISYPSVPGAQIGTGGTVSTTGTGPALTYLHTYTAPGTYTSGTRPTWVTTANITANLNVPFSTQLSATDISTVTYSIAAGNTLPAGISLTSSGVLSGTITAPTLGFYINAVNAIGGTTARVFDVSNTYSVAYLVVGGGGSPAGTPGSPGRYGGGGGGAFIPGTAAFQLGASYPISVGPAVGPTSVLSGPAPFSPITAPGGGPGASVGSNGTPSPGGSGGGGNTSGTGPPNWNFTIGGTGGTYGNPGGAGAFSVSGSTPLSPTQNIAGGGGGGAGGSGGGGTGFTGAGGQGGVGAIWPYTGPAVFYAGGSGGSSQQSPGTPNPGADGSGAGYYGGGLGIQGVVILAVATPVYPGSAPGAAVSTPPAAPGYTVLTYTNPGTYTA